MLMPSSKGRRDRTRSARAQETQAAQRQAEARKLTPAQYTRRRAIGWALVALGVAVGVQHFLSHVALFTVISRGADDLLLGYPLAGALGVAGAIVLTRV
jgi:hypothetical protein